jgi:penicillin-insensitive murein endopeptidase
MCVRGALVAAMLLVALPARGDDKPPNPWAEQSTPSRGPSHSIGGYSAGCLAGGDELPIKGRGWQVMLPERKRYFAHSEMVVFVHKLAIDAIKARLGTVSLGDLSQPRGGPAPSGHSSHQTGLDVDIWYVVGKKGMKKGPSMVRGTRPAAGWGARQMKLLELAARDPRVERVFVHPVLKRALCEKVKGDRSWLHRIRPWWGHDEHFHVRLKCPDGDTGCVPQDPIAEGDGCAEIAGWLAPEKAAARAEKQKAYQSRVGAVPVLPDACSEVLR